MKKTIAIAMSSLVFGYSTHTVEELSTSAPNPLGTMAKADSLINEKTKAESDDGRTIKIPVIFHVLYANSSQNVSTDSLKAELQNLRNDFLAANTDLGQVNLYFKAKVGKPNVAFYLADTVLQQRGEQGIIRIMTRNNKTNLYKTSKVVNSRRFLNVYVGDIKYRGKHTDGVTPVPSSAVSHEDDAVHLRYLWIGGHYRLLTHETGHWLGLWHVFQDGCADGDGISDTPPQKSATDGACDQCPPRVADPSCTTGTPSNYNNFMDYSGCRKMFTEMQAKRIRETVMNYRPELWHASK